jgi:hypothetical protein
VRITAVTTPTTRVDSTPAIRRHDDITPPLTRAHITEWPTIRPSGKGSRRTPRNVANTDTPRHHPHDRTGVIGHEDCPDEPSSANSQAKPGPPWY